MNPKRCYPKQTAFVYDLYTVPGVPAEQAYFVEKSFLKHIDDWAAQALAVMVRPNSTSADLRPKMLVGWARFIYSLIARNPENIKRLRQQSDSISPETFERLRGDYDTWRSPDDPETFDEWKERILSRRVNIPAQRMLPTIINSKRMISETTCMQRTTRDFHSTKHSMLTSDRPIIMTNGIAHPEAHIVIPLSPRCLFFSVRTEETRQTLMSIPPDEIVWSVNNKVAEQAVKFVYGTDDSQLRFVANRLGKMVPSTPLDNTISRGACWHWVSCFPQPPPP